MQSHPPAEVLIVDDASTDDTHEVAQSYGNYGVRYIRVDVRDPLRAREAGYRAISSDVVCFLDADDRLSPHYLSDGRTTFDQPNIGIVYSDMELFGSRSGVREFPKQFDRGRFERENFLHAGSLVRREALTVSDAFDTSRLSSYAAVTADWLMWKRVVASGWAAKKQRSLYEYRQHGDSMTGNPCLDRSYYFEAGLEGEIVTLFIPLSGRHALWAQLADYLERQTWPHARIQLRMLDTSGNPEFSSKVRQWALTSDYADIRVTHTEVGHSGLADEPRRESADSVRLAMARIYNRLATEVATPFVWVLEDDVVPPGDACEQLLGGFDSNTFSVSGAYRSRFHKGFVAWDASHRTIASGRRGIERIGGNGFGCVMLRSHVLKQSVFTASNPIPDFDKAFYARLQISGLQARINWSVLCKHYDSDGRCHEPNA